MRLVRIIVAIPLIAVLVVFALSNREPVVLSFLGYETGAPLSVAILVAGAIAFLLGALLLWFGELRQRRRARRAEHRVAVLERELAEARPVPASSAPLPASAIGGSTPPAGTLVLPGPAAA